MKSRKLCIRHPATVFEAFDDVVLDAAEQADVLGEHRDIIRSGLPRQKRGMLWGKEITIRLGVDVNYTAGVSLVIVRDGKEYVLVNYHALSFMGYSGDSTKIGRTQRVGLISPRLEWSVEQVDNVVA